jgi:DTW domain-containing protein YfiP
MAYLCIRNSLRIEGADFSEDETANRMIQDPDLFSVVLYPGPGATNLSMVPAPQRAALVPTGRELNVFVLDGTWKTAGKMIRLSRNLQVLPLVCFVPLTPSVLSHSATASSRLLLDHRSDPPRYRSVCSNRE